MYRASDALVTGDAVLSVEKVCVDSFSKAYVWLAGEYSP